MNKEISDGYHTFDELYKQRNNLWIALCRIAHNKGLPVWRTIIHSDGTFSSRGWFVLVIDKERGEQMSYHMPMDMWTETDFAETLNRGYEYDGHTAEDVLNRISKLWLKLNKHE